jgi:integrase
MAGKQDREELTNPVVRKLEARPAGRWVKWDSELKGFGCRITANGAKSFIFMGRNADHRKMEMVTLGPFNGKNTEQARGAAKRAMEHLAEGRSPLVERIRRTGTTVAMAVDAYVKDKASDRQPPRTLPWTESYLRHDLLGQARNGVGWIDGERKLWRDRRVTDIRREDVSKLLGDIKQARGAWAARHVLAAGRKLFGWMVKGHRFGVTTSPFSGLDDSLLGFQRPEDKRRKRLLSDMELKAIWDAAPKVDPIYGALVRCLMLVPARLNELARARWDEIIEDKVTGPRLVVPEQRFKSGHVHEIPLAPRVVALLKALPRVNEGALIFSPDGGTAGRSGSFWKAKLDEASGVGQWVHHDLRHAGRTRMRQQGVARDVCELMLGHSLPQLDAIYDHGLFREEKRDAAAKLEAHILGIVEPKKPPRPKRLR